MDTKEQAIKELYYWKRGTAGGFATKLFDLWGKADHINKVKLSIGFPVVAEAINEWQSSPDEEEFFNKYIKGEK